MHITLQLFSIQIILTEEASREYVRVAVLWKIKAHFNCTETFVRLTERRQYLLIKLLNVL